MKKVLKVSGIVLADIILVIVLAFTWFSVNRSNQAKKAYSLLGPEAPILSVQDRSFRDLNKNGTLDPYEDSSAPVEERVNDQLEDLPYDSGDPLYPFGHGLGYQ